ncbi:MAG: DUF2089 domain-containing protein [Kosmotoga sp.]|uniref:DUF2089 domain-containing protein n=1 Tax=Kosmotoga sp. TaxID=1955248 RepID=UPI001DB1F57C|nr:DUF2089 domain-containing protein [Kosmotoga sp.]MBO8167416.1 DUF2089 domain-containing protein [Kosmotoga sp.]MCD6159561.1 DUF2089 domain-containing protein [Kosmotoga sp.]
MKGKKITNCPVCGEKLVITEYHCDSCGTTIRGRFELDEIMRLSPDQLYFLKIFIKNRGNLSEVQKELNISYPTAKNRLEDIVRSMGFEVAEDEKEETVKILEKLEAGELNPSEALEMLKKVKKRK